MGRRRSHASTAQKPSRKRHVTSKTEPLPLNCKQQDCVICLRSATETKRLFNCCDTCTTRICEDCLLSYVRCAVRDRSMLPLRCPGLECNSIIPRSHLANALPAPLCEEVTKGLTIETKRSNMASSAMSTEDRRNYHHLMKLATRKGWKSCPRCNALIDRYTGCSSVYCRCGNTFDWNHRPRLSDGLVVTQGYPPGAPANATTAGIATPQNQQTANTAHLRFFLPRATNTPARTHEVTVRVDVSGPARSGGHFAHVHRARAQVGRTLPVAPRNITWSGAIQPNDMRSGVRNEAPLQRNETRAAQPSAAGSGAPMRNASRQGSANVVHRSEASGSHHGVATSTTRRKNAARATKGGGGLNGSAEGSSRITRSKARIAAKKRVTRSTCRTEKE